MYATKRLCSIILSFFLCITYANNCLCMEPEESLPAQATEQPYDPELMELRKNLGAGSFLKTLPASIRLVYKEQNNERFGKCIYYTITQILEITGKPALLRIIEDEDWLNNITLINYFNPTAQPQLGDLAVYCSDVTNKQPLHFGIVTGFKPLDNTPIITSKWGTMPYIFEHELFAIPLLYGNAVQFFTLKNKYRQGGKKTILIKELQSAIEKSETNKKILFIVQMALLQFASGNDIGALNSHLHLNKQLSISGKALFLIKAYPGLDINIYNRNHQTPLILAAIRGDYAMTNMFLSFGANINKQDKDGNTALMLAAQNGFDAVVKLLLAYGANQTIKNNNGETALNISERLYQNKIVDLLKGNI